MEIFSLKFRIFERKFFDRLKIRGRNYPFALPRCHWLQI